jgi:von Willebrand factor type A C-terminal domain
MSQPDFTVEISQNEYLPEGGDDVNAITTVTSPDTAGAARAADASSAEIIIIDCSGSVRLKKKVNDADEMALDTRSTKTVRTRK